MYKIFYFCLLIYMIYLLICSIIIKSKSLLKKLFIIEAMSIIGVIFYVIIYNELYYYFDFEPLALIVISICALGVYVILFVISVIFRILLNKKIKKQENKKGTLISIIMFIVLFVASLVVDLKPSIEKRIEEKQIMNNAINLLEKKYGDNNYKLKSNYDGEHFKFLVECDKLNETFEIAFYDSDKTIITNNFLELYALENNWYNKDEYSSLDEYLRYEIEEELKNKVFNIEDYDVKFVVNLEDAYNKIDYGKIPTIEEIKENAIISFSRIEIYKEFTEENKEEFKKFIINVYKNYLEKIKFKT